VRPFGRINSERKTLHVLAAPDKFKGTLTARDAANAIKLGVQTTFPQAAIDLLPLADGGDGTVDTLTTALGGDLEYAGVTGPTGRPVKAPIGHLGGGRHVIEAASSAGLTLLQSDRLQPLTSTTRGVGELIAVVANKGAAEILIGVGGTASTDGGTGAATAIGWRFLDHRERELAPGGGSLVNLARIDGDSKMAFRLPVVAACDVTNPLIGANGAAHIFAPQKGASPADVGILAEGLEILAERLRNDLGLEIGGLNHSGAGGGLAAGLHAFFDATLRPGFELIAQVIGLQAAIRKADIVITGEGSLDRQSLSGKAAVGVARLAKALGVRCVAVAGSVELGRRELESVGFSATRSLVDMSGPRRAFEDSFAAVMAATAELLEAQEQGANRA
jgi:glycerate 2-kinase